MGESALIVKAADVLDSYHHYKAIGDKGELQRSIDMAGLIIETGLTDPIVELLKEMK